MSIALPRRLYWRMAFWIGAALAAFVTLGIASVVLVASIELRNYATARQGGLGQEAAAVLASGGRPALERWLREDADVPVGVTAYVLDDQSNDILGRALPAELTDFVRSSVVGPPEQATGNYRPVRLAPQIVGPDGDAYAFLVLPSRIGVFGNAATALGVVVAALLVIGAVAWLIARTFGRPIGELQRTARELALGHIDARVPPALTERADELGALAADFNLMAEKLSALIAGRQQLLAEISHELRSPLARLQAALALAVRRESLRPEDRERVEAEMRRMDHLIGELLRFSRLDAAATLERRLLRVDELVAGILADEEVEAAAAGCRLELATRGELALVGDPALLRSAIENILRNAIRYSPPGAAVSVEAEARDGRIAITILDRGPGVPEGQHERIFEPFVRVPGPGPGTGTGLGLAIARRVFAAHGGSVRAQARPGGGLCVRAELPAADLD